MNYEVRNKLAKNREKTPKVFHISHFKFHTSGFTLVETLMVMVILGFVMLAASGLASTVVRSAAQNQSRVQAIYLTQECTELSRNVRDSSWRQNLDWRCPFAPTGFLPVAYDPSDPSSLVFTIERTGVGVNPVGNCQDDLGVRVAAMQIDDTWLYQGPNRLTHISTGTKSQFRRYFTIDEYDDAAETLTLTCHVDWGKGRTEMSQVLTNWRKK